VRNYIDDFMVFWCRAMHDHITWPQRGRYQCKSCGRIYLVPWAEQEPGIERPRLVEIRPTLQHARTA
jgi:hypothetical protein